MSNLARSFEDDVAFLSRYGAVHVLESPAGGRIAISGLYQARIMTSVVEAQGASLGFVNRSFIEAGKVGAPTSSRERDDETPGPATRKLHGRLARLKRGNS
jgi:hypothetical protein